MPTQFLDRKNNIHKKPNNISSRAQEYSFGIYSNQNNLLLVKPSFVDLWEFPGGKKENNETKLETLKREFLEETGSEIIDFDKNPIKEIKINFYAENTKEYLNTVMTFFIITKIKNQGEIIDKENIKESKLIPLNSLNLNNTNNIHYKIIKDFLNF